MDEDPPLLLSPPPPSPPPPSLPIPQDVNDDDVNDDVYDDGNDYDDDDDDDNNNTNMCNSKDFICYYDVTFTTTRLGLELEARNMKRVRTVGTAGKTKIGYGGCDCETGDCDCYTIGDDRIVVVVTSV